MNPSYLSTEIIPRNRIMAVSLILIYGLSVYTLLLAGFSTANAEDSDDADKKYTFFIGLDVSIPLEETGDKAHRVIGLKHNAAEVRINNQSYYTHIEEISNIRMKRAPKISDVEINILDKKEERTYTPANDPRLKWMQAQASFSDLGDDVRPSQLGEVIVANTQISGNVFYGGAMAGVSFSGYDAMAQAGALAEKIDKMQTAMSKFQAGGNAGGADLGSPAYYMRKMQEELAEELFDALSVTFKISCNRYLKDPYLIMVVNATGSEHGATTNSYIYFQSLPDITPETRKIYIRQGGFPPGFTYDDVLIGIYVDGEEIASDFSQKKVKMTHDDALQYLRLQYAADNENNSVPPMPIWKKFPEHLAMQVGDENLNKVAYVHLSETGDIEWAAWDAEGNDRVDMMYLLALNEFPFYPAYVEGKPTGTTAKIKLADFIF